ncbi:HNH endonuclease (plasmid) [Mycobacterium sp. SMC-2]|uniref:HNH endonuclease n=1 Tax=Mycobacterium sp. SMC-2 TaxID=2857058 RepID=UPI0021B2DC37|nr:HNH endonuclease [Mycobacterium sp. SMC-2]UXA06561.1 HNH endonuclease [Mycobacterium sp. SMC-2]UXA09653.1 HNH endonuclease [Mycobacterium sp. SMC-2]
MAVSKRLRFEILRRDNHACRYCGATAPDVKLTVDHVIPEALGGSDESTNLVTACSDCNSGKSSVPADAALVTDVAGDAMRWAAAMRQAADEIAAEDDAIERILDAVYDAWKPYWIPNDWPSSVVTFIRAGLTQDTLLYLVDTARRKRGLDDRWAYFCGCCWKRIRQLQDRAHEIVSTAENAPRQRRHFSPPAGPPRRSAITKRTPSNSPNSGAAATFSTTFWDAPHRQRAAMASIRTAETPRAP